MKPLDAITAEKRIDDAILKCACDIQAGERLYDSLKALREETRLVLNPHMFEDQEDIGVVYDAQEIKDCFDEAVLMLAPHYRVEVRKDQVYVPAENFCLLIWDELARRLGL